MFMSYTKSPHDLQLRINETPRFGRGNLRIMEERIHSHQLATTFDIPCFPESEKSHLIGGGTEAGLQFREKG